MCDSWRTKALAGIAAVKPSFVLMSDRSAEVRGTGGALISDAVWQAGETKTITAIKSKGIRLAVIADITAFVQPLPSCLAIHSSNVQKCSVANPNPVSHQHIAQEKAAALAAGVPYIDPQPWLCTTVCSPVIGNMAAYFDAFHVTATYAAFLSNVWSTALAPMFK
jgi:hypothetical protein